MKPHLFYLLRFLALTSAANTSPLLLNDTEVVNTAAHVGAIDPRFTIEAYFNGPKLPLVSCLVSTVDFLVVLALQDFSGSMGEAAWKIDDYPEVGIVVAPGTVGGRIEVRFVMWGLRQGAAHMIRLIRFQAVTFTLSWEGEKVGTIELVAWPSASQGTHTNSTWNPTQPSNLSIDNPPSSLSLLPQNATITTTNTQNGHLRVRTILTGSAVPLFDVFLLVMAVLVGAAELGPRERLRYYAFPATGAGLRIAFTESVPARTSPPFLEVRWLIRSMAFIPRCMVKMGASKEAEVFVEVDHVSVAEGLLGKNGGGIGLMNVDSNESVS
ncbi:hypothetical protein IMSHALPRED_004743 [Imshaugia aleurites]|uniref:Uncharacterized protein n=1 Tax=Imshaugia aleurites TaxID=172621 RepID=A0A8H3FFD2_9LECA|nr:hypothetical protein IMSHALPRED_004743 [Imshaugia aleurites]